MHEELNIRLATIDDMERIFELSNDDVVRQNSINKEKIKWESHVKWFQARIQNTEYPFYVIENGNHDLIAQVRFDNQDGDIVISVSMCPAFRGRGFGAEIIKMAVNKSGFKRVVAYVYEYNVASVKSFEKAGFEKPNMLKFIYNAQKN